MGLQTGNYLIQIIFYGVFWELSFRAGRIKKRDFNDHLNWNSLYIY